MEYSDPLVRGTQPTVDDVDFKALYCKTRYEVHTADHWTLSITRYRPQPQPFEQPILGEPMLLVHGYGQNRHAWTAGQFVKNMLFFGADIHILELRGHGKSSIVRQIELHQTRGTRLPADLDYGWDLDSYFLYDLPAAVAGVKRLTKRERIFYCGHSMGGMLGYGYAGIHDDLEGLITIGAASDLGSGFLPIRVVSWLAPLAGASIDASLAAANLVRAAAHAGRRLLSKDGGPPPEKLVFKATPIPEILAVVGRLLDDPKNQRKFEKLSKIFPPLVNPARVTAADMRWILREGAEREPRLVTEQFARWIRDGKLICYRTGYDFKRNFKKIKIPMAIIFGDLDWLASVKSTRSVYRAARSDYLLWRPVKGNSHLELTMGYDIRQICYDIKNLIEYAKTHRGGARRPSLPRRDRPSGR